MGYLDDICDMDDKGEMSDMHVTSGLGKINW